MLQKILPAPPPANPGRTDSVSEEMRRESGLATEEINRSIQVQCSDVGVQIAPSKNECSSSK